MQMTSSSRPRRAVLFLLAWAVFADGAAHAQVSGVSGKHRPSCGVWALDALARAVGTNRISTSSWAGLVPPPNGFSLADLQRIGEQAGLRLLAVERAKSDGLPVPSIMHWRRGHSRRSSTDEGTPELLTWQQRF